MNSIGAKVPPGAPRSDFRGLVYPGMSVLHAGSDILAFDSLVGGFDPAADQAMPASLRPVAPPDNCHPTPPGKDAVLYSAILEGSERKSTVWTLDQSAMTSRALAFLRNIKERGDFDKEISVDATVGQYPLAVTDVLITETSTPVYLVLQSGTSMVWNVTLAPGVRVERLVALGTGPVAVALADASVPVEIIGNMADSCKVYPARPLDDSWQVIRNERDYGVAFDHDKFETPFHNYRGWFEGAFGQRFETQGRAAQDAGFVLIGPQPTGESTPLPAWQSLAGRDLLFSGSKNMTAISHADEFNQKTHDMLVAMLEQAIGGPISDLAPVIEERVAQ